MANIKNLQKLMCILLVVVLVLFFYQMKTLHSLSRIGIHDSIYLDGVSVKATLNKRFEDVASDMKHAVSNDSLHNVLRKSRHQKPNMKVKVYPLNDYKPKSTRIACKSKNKTSTLPRIGMGGKHKKQQSLSNTNNRSSVKSTRTTGKSKNKRSTPKQTRHVSKNSSNIQDTCQQETDSLSTEDHVKKAVDWFTINNDTEKDDRINRHKFVYHLNSNLCSKKNISIVILIHSAVNHAGQRHLVRSTWGSVNTSVSQPTIIFFLGESFRKNKTLQTEIKKESKKYGDIVQGDFADTYKNITYKHVMAIHWLTSQCDDVRTVVKIDDDIFIDIYKLANFSINIGHIPNTVYCQTEYKAHPRKTGKWKLSEAEYPFPFFPKYCDGMAYIISMDVARKLVKASENMAFFWIDDIYVTGILASKAGVGHKKFKFGHESFLKYSYKRGQTKNMLKRYMFFAHLFDWKLLMWLLFEDIYN